MAIDLNRYRLLPPALGAVVLALAVLGWRYPLPGLLAETGWGGRHWPLALLGLAGLYLLRPFVLWPLSVLSVFVGYVFGFPSGLPVVLAGTVVTCLPPFVVASRYGDQVRGFGWLSEKGASVVDATGERRGVIAARLSPAPADAVSCGAGIAGVSAQAFVVGTLVGELPWAIGYVLLGESLRAFSATAFDGADVRLVAVAALAAVSLVARPLYAWLRRERRTADDP